MAMKKYENPMLQVVSICKKDIIVTSPQIYGEEASNKGGDGVGLGFAPGQRGLDFNSWYEGY